MFFAAIITLISLKYHQYAFIFIFSIIAEVVENYVISSYNHPARDDYNTEALIFKMAIARFFDVFNEIKCSWFDNHLSNCTKLYSSRGLFDNIH